MSAAVRILVVDVDPSTFRKVSLALPHGLYEIRSAADGKNGLAIAKSWQPHVLLLPVDLPGMDGLTLVKTLRSSPDGAIIPVVFLAERSAVQERMQGFLLGADVFIPKPLDVLDLDARISASLKSIRKSETSVRRRKSESNDFSTLMTGFRGDLSQLGLPSLLGLLERGGNTGVLVILPEPELKKVRLYIRDGRVERACIDGHEKPKNVELIYRLLTRTRGKFDFRPMVLEQLDEIRKPTTQILLEGARRLDQRRTAP